MGKKPGPKGIDWDAERERYVTGDETFRAIAARLGIGRKAVEIQAGRGRNAGETWGRMRAAWRAGTAQKSADRAGDAVATVLARVRSKAAAVAEKALIRLEERIDGDHVEMTNKDLIGAAKLALATKIELGGGRDGLPVQLSANLDALSLDELRRLAEG